MAKFTLYNDKLGDFRWRFLADDNAVIAKSSEGHKTKADCLASIEAIRKDAPGAAVDPELHPPPRVAVTRGSHAAPAGRPPVPGPVYLPKF